MRIILLLLGILITGVAMGEVYRSVDENGNVIFSDKPSPDAEKIEIQEVQTIDPGNVPKYEYTPPPEPPEPAYKKIVITSPVNDETISANDGDITVSFQLEPELKEGDAIVLYLDGSKVAEGTGNLALTNLDRGTHTISAAVKNSEGNEIARSESISFTIQRHSIQHKPSTVGKPPAKKP